MCLFITFSIIYITYGKPTAVVLTSATISHTATVDIYMYVHVCVNKYLFTLTSEPLEPKVPRGITVKYAGVYIGGIWFESVQSPHFLIVFLTPVSVDSVRVNLAYSDHLSML